MAPRSKPQTAARLGQSLAAARTESGLTQEQVAEILEVDLQTIGRMERGVVWPTLPRLLSLAELYKVPVSLLLRQNSPLTKDIAEDLEGLLARLTEADRVWVKEWLRELCERLVQTPTHPAKRQRR